MMSAIIYDVIIVGAGPSGCACAIGLKDAGLRVVVIDKAVFPREKVCGDGLTLDVMNQLPLLSKSIADAFNKSADKWPVGGAVIYLPNKQSIKIAVQDPKNGNTMHVFQRRVFDSLLVEEVKNQPNTEVFENTALVEVTKEKEHFKLSTTRGDMYCRFLVGADGANSVVGKSLGTRKFLDKDKITAIRCHYKLPVISGEAPFMHFYLPRKISPAYIWVFPEGHGIYNVGIGLTLHKVKKAKLKPVNILEDEINNGMLKDIFKGAERLDDLKGKVIPLGRKGRPLSGDSFLLTGDAAGLANALTGEGIGNALRSGRVAAWHICRCFASNEFSLSFNKSYDNEIYRRMGNEFRMYRMMQYFCQNKFIASFLVKRLAAVYHLAYGQKESVAKKRSVFAWLVLFVKSFYA